MTCSLYVITHLENGVPCSPCKIGIARNPRKRLESLQTGNPKRLHLLHNFSCPERGMALYLEQAFHSINSEKRIGGEWFDIAPALSLSLIGMYVEMAAMLSGEELSDEVQDALGLTEAQIIIAELSEQ